jgi:CheY-like chemotaxis protein/HPt (histidine-containing phosphotransfer) domain-containing protein
MRVVVDATRLRQVVMNLLGNAVKFTPAGAVEVRLLHTQGGACFRLEVVDTGPGVRAAHHAKLFHTFERLNAEAVSSIEGTGLGLAIAARLIQLMRGQIGYQDNPAGGSIFWLELPVGLHTGAATIDVALPAPAPHARQMRVLVADDEALNRSIAQEFLRRAGHAVVCVSNGAAAVEAATQGDFDAILMDVRMPGMNGLEATRLIRNLPPPRGQVCVVAVTAQAFAQQIETCRQAGMDLHVSKPFSQAALVAALDIAARTRHLGPVAPPVETQAATHVVGHAEPAAPVFDSAAFASVAEYLPAPDIARYLRTLLAHCADVRARLNQPMPQPADDELAERAHSMCGNAGILGFASIAAAARALEHAVETAAPDMQAHACDLAGAIDIAMPLIKQQLARMEAVPVG